MKILFGILIGAGLVFGGSAFAASNQLQGIVHVSGPETYETVHKYYDYDNKVVCYTNKNGYSGGISCLQN